MTEKIGGLNLTREDLLDLRSELNKSSNQNEFAAKSLFKFFTINEGIRREIVKDNPDLEIIASALNLNLKFESLPNKTGGFSYKKSNEFFVVINKYVKPSKRLFTFLHELFHLIHGDTDGMNLLFTLESYYENEKNETRYTLSYIIMRNMYLVPFSKTRLEKQFVVRREEPIVSFSLEGKPIRGAKHQSLYNDVMKIYQQEIEDSAHKEHDFYCDFLTKEIVKLINDLKDKEK